MDKENSLNKIKQLTLFLFVSGSFNIFLVAFLFYWVFKEQPPTPYCELMPIKNNIKQIKCEADQTALINHYKTLKFQQLRAKLASQTMVIRHLKERDLALATLVNFHDFDLRKALGNITAPLKQQILVHGNGLEKLLIFPDLNDKQFATIIEFATKEKWPFKAKGLFQLLKKNINDSTLADAFYLTPEFYAVKTLFLRSGINVDNQELLKIIIEGEWGLLSAFRERQNKSLDFSSENRQRFLLDYIKAGSCFAAHLLIKTDCDYVLSRLNDEALLSILRLLDQKSEDARQFTSSLISLPRGIEVRRLAEARLEEYKGVQPVIQEKVLTSLKPKEVVRLKIPAKKPEMIKKERIYIVQEGDSLWKIAKKFQLNVDFLKSYNRLVSDLLQPGTLLKIPD